MQYTDLEQQRKYVVEKLQEQPDPEHLWECILAFQGYEFRTISGLPFTYQLKKGKNGNLTKELWIDRRKNSKSLAWSSVLKAFEKTVNIKEKNIDKLLLEIAQQHIVFERIHPFQDGNGRTGRILINQQLINNGLPPISIKPTGKYRQAFRRYNNSGDLSQMVYILAKSELESFDRILQQESRYLLNRDGRNVEVKSKLRATEREIDL